MRASGATRPRRGRALALASALATTGIAREGLGEEPEEVVVRSLPREGEAFETNVPANLARSAPGTQGDPVKVLESLPGLARPSFGSGALVVWGASPTDTRVYVDGVEIPQLYHGMGLRSTLHPALIQSVELAPGGFGAAYGRALGGLVQVKTARVSEGTHAEVAVDTFDASALASAAVAPGIRVAVAARGSYIDREVVLVSPAGRGASVGDYFPIPRYSDYQAKVDIELRERESLSVVFLGSHDALTRAVTSADPAEIRSEHTASAFHRLYARYHRLGDDGSRSDVTPFIGYDTSERDDTFGGSPIRLSNDSWHYGLRSSHTAFLAPEVNPRTHAPARVALTLGLDALGSQSSLARTGTLALPPREGDLYVFGETPGGSLNTDTWKVQMLDLAPYVAVDIGKGAVHLRPEVRVSATYIEGSRQTPRIGDTPPVGFSSLTATVDPRFAVTYTAAKALTLMASGGLYHQPPQPEDLSAVFGSPGLPMSHALHAVVGEALKLTASLTLEMNAFAKRFGNMAFRSRLATPRLASALAADGEGRAWGVQWLLRQGLWRGFFGWASYTLSRSERRYAGDRTYRLFDFDQPHVFALVGSQTLGRWTFGARFRYASGLPRTPVAGAYYDAKDDRYDPIFGAQNALRIPPFASLDLRVERSVPAGPVTVHVYVEALNVTNRGNDEEIAYSANYAQRAYVTGLPALALVGIRGELGWCWSSGGLTRPPSPQFCRQVGLSRWSSGGLTLPPSRPPPDNPGGGGFKGIAPCTKALNHAFRVVNNIAVGSVRSRTVTCTVGPNRAC